MTLHGTLPCPNPLALHGLILNAIPAFDGQDSCDPVLEVFCGGLCIYSSAQQEQDNVKSGLLSDGYNLVFRTVLESEQRPVKLSEDVELRVSHRVAITQDSPSRPPQLQLMCSFCFHTGFMGTGLIR
jgi:hypothetical protein